VEGAFRLGRPRRPSGVGRAGRGLLDLGLGPELPGLNSWVSQLNGGTSRSQVVIGFSESPEHVGNLAPHIDSGIWVAG